MQKPRIVILGLDGLSLDMFLRLAKDNRFRNFHKVFKKSFIRVHESIPPTTPVGWTSIITGVNPALHGIWGFTKPVFHPRKGILHRFYNSYDVKYPRLFEMTAIFGIKSLVINYPLTYPLKALYLKNNAIVSDTLLGIKPEFHPTTLKQYEEFFKTSNGSNIHEKILRMIDGIEILSDKVDWNLLICMLDAPDKLFHKDIRIISRLKGADLEVFNAIDNLIGHFINIADNLIIVSDHGLKIYRKWISPLAALYTYKILNNQLTTLPDAIIQNLVRIIYGSKHLSLIHFLIGKIITSKNILTDSLFNKIKKETFNTKISVDIADPDNVWLIYFINEELRNTCEKILSKYFADLLDINRPENIFNGPYFPELPSLFIKPKFVNDYYVFFSEFSKYFTKLKFSYRIVGRHHPLGVFIAYGWKIKHNVDLKNPIRPYDMVPTVLAMLQLPIPSKTDGRVLPITPYLKGKYFPTYNYLTALKIAKIKKKLKRL